MGTKHTIATATFVALFTLGCGASTTSGPDETSTTDLGAAATTATPGRTDAATTDAAETAATQAPSTGTSTTDASAETLPVPSPDPQRVAWARELVEVINTLQAGRAVANEEFTRMWRPGELGYEAQRALYRSDVDGLEIALADLPSPFDPPDATDQALADFIDATRVLADDARRILEALIEDEDELRTSARDGRGRSPAIDSVLGEHRDLVSRWQATCFDLQLSIAQLDVDPIDCIGTTSTDVEPLPDGVDANDVSVSVECTRGDSFDELPFDTAPYAFLATKPADTSWIRTVVTIANSTDKRIQVDPSFLVRWFDTDGESIVTTEWLEPWAPSLSALPGQTVIRTGYRFDDSFVIAARDNLPTELFERVFDTAAGCEPVGTPGFWVIDDDEFVDPDNDLDIEQTECGRDDSSGRWRVSYQVTNEGADPVRVTIGAELLDANGDRQGSGGSGETVVIGPGETVSSAGWSVYYTIADVDAVVECRLLEVALS